MAKSERFNRRSPKQRQDPVTSEILDRQPPADIDAEMGVLGSLMIAPDAVDEVTMMLREADFHDDAHQKLFGHIKDMHDSGKKIDIMLLTDRLQSAGHLELIGGAPYLYKIVNSVPHAAHAKYYAEIVRDKSTYRSLIHAGTDILRDAYDESGEAMETLGRAEQRIFSILDQRGTSTVSTFKDILLKAMDRMDARMSGDTANDGVDTGFVDVDRQTGGLHNSELIILAARPSMGKTALALNIAEHVAIDANVPTLFVSLEMSSVELADRMLCSIAKVNGHRLRNGTLSNEDRRRMIDTAGRLSLAPLYVDDSPSRMVTEIAAAARRIRRNHDRLGLIVIDYLQLIEPDNPTDSRQEQVAKIARRLKGMAREIDVPVLCLAQVNRQAEDGKEHRPRLSHLRESGAIEQDADVVMFVHREEYYRKREEQEQFAGQAELIVAKQRNGPVGDVDLIWRKEYTRFEDKAPDRHSEFDDHNGSGEFDTEF